MQTCRVADQTAGAGTRKDLTKRSCCMTEAASAEENDTRAVVVMSKRAFLVLSGAGLEPNRQGSPASLPKNPEGAEGVHQSDAV